MSVNAEIGGNTHMVLQKDTENSMDGVYKHQQIENLDLESERDS